MQKVVEGQIAGKCFFYRLDEIVNNDTYASTWTMKGIFIADPSDPVNSGVPYEAKGMSIIKFRNKSTDVYYQRDYYTEGDIMIAIPGLDQAAYGFRVFYLCAVDPKRGTGDISFTCFSDFPASINAHELEALLYVSILLYLELLCGTILFLRCQGSEPYTQPS